MAATGPLPDGCGAMNATGPDGGPTECDLKVADETANENYKRVEEGGGSDGVASKQTNTDKPKQTRRTIATAAAAAAVCIDRPSPRKPLTRLAFV